MKYKHCIYMTVFISLLFIHTRSFASEHVTAGWVEKAVLYPKGIIFHAKLDTGAKTTSINATDPEFFERDGKRWSKFSITNRNNETVTIEAPMVRDANIKRHFGQQQIRPVIMLDICIGNVRKIEEVNLVDRSNLNYQLLVGRNFLKDDLLIDSGSTYLLSPACTD